MHLAGCPRRATTPARRGGHFFQIEKVLLFHSPPPGSLSRDMPAEVLRDFVGLGWGSDTGAVDGDCAGRGDRLKTEDASPNFARIDLYSTAHLPRCPRNRETGCAVLRAPLPRARHRRGKRGVNAIGRRDFGSTVYRERSSLEEKPTGAKIHNAKRVKALAGFPFATSPARFEEWSFAGSHRANPPRRKTRGELQNSAGGVRSTWKRLTDRNGPSWAGIRC